MYTKIKEYILIFILLSSNQVLSSVEGCLLFKSRTNNWCILHVKGIHTVLQWKMGVISKIVTQYHCILMVITLIYISYSSRKKFLIPSSFFWSCSITKRIWDAVTKPETNQSLNLSTTFKYMLLVFQTCSSIRSRAAWAINWFR